MMTRQHARRKGAVIWNRPERRGGGHLPRDYRTDLLIPSGTFWGGERLMTAGLPDCRVPIILGALGAVVFSTAFILAEGSRLTSAVMRYMARVATPGLRPRIAVLVLAIVSWGVVAVGIHCLLSL
jgi:hypothetical protein